MYTIVYRNIVISTSPPFSSAQKQRVRCLLRPFLAIKTLSFRHLYAYYVSCYRRRLACEAPKQTLVFNAFVGGGL